MGEIPSLLSAYAGKYESIGVPSLGIVGFYWVPALDEATMKKLKGSSAVDEVYYYQDWNSAVGSPDKSDDVNGEMALPVDRDDVNHHDDDDGGWTSSASPLFRRARTSTASNFWASSVASLPKGMFWRADGTDSYDVSDSAQPFRYQWDDTGGSADYTIYCTHEARVWTAHPEFDRTNGFLGTLDRLLPGGRYDVPNFGTAADAAHGTCVTSYAVGAKLGICKKCRAIWLDTALWSPGDPGFDRNFIRERGIAHLMASYQEIVSKGNAKRSVINMSWSYPPGMAIDALLKSTRWVLGELDEMGVVLVVSAGNHANEEGKEINRYPARFANPNAAQNPYGELKNMIVVGASNNLGHEWAGGQTSSYMTTFAPGEAVTCPSDPLGEGNDRYKAIRDGTSIAAP